MYITLDWLYVHQGLHTYKLYLCIIWFSSSETELLLLVLKRAATEHFNDTKANAQTLLAVSMKLIKSKRPKQAADVSILMYFRNSFISLSWEISGIAFSKQNYISEPHRFNCIPGRNFGAKPPNDAYAEVSGKRQFIMCISYLHLIIWRI